MVLIYIVLDRTIMHKRREQTSQPGMRLNFFAFPVIFLSYISSKLIESSSHSTRIKNALYLYCMQRFGWELCQQTPEEPPSVVHRSSNLTSKDIASLCRPLTLCASCIQICTSLCTAWDIWSSSFSQASDQSRIIHNFRLPDSVPHQKWLNIAPGDFCSCAASQVL